MRNEDEDDYEDDDQIISRQDIQEGRWIKVATRDDLPGPTSRVLMFVRGVGPRIGTVTRMFDLPWHVCDPDWLDPTRKLRLMDVACYINLDKEPWPQPAPPSPQAEETKESKQ